MRSGRYLLSGWADNNFRQYVHAVAAAVEIEVVGANHVLSR